MRTPSNAVSGVSVRPLEVRTGVPSRDAVRMRYASGRSAWAEAAAKTSRGPVTSRLCTPSKRTMSTLCWDVMGTMLLGPPDGRNDGFPTLSAIGVLSWSSIADGSVLCCQRGGWD